MTPQYDDMTSQDYIEVLSDGLNTMQEVLDLLRHDLEDYKIALNKISKEIPSEKL